MANPAGVDSKTFLRVLRRNIQLPLAMSFVLCAVFVGLLFNLLAANRKVEHSDIVIASTNEAYRLVIDAETGFRGFLVTGKDVFLEPWDRAIRTLPTALQELGHQISDNKQQVEGLERVRLGFQGWKEYADEAIQYRRETVQLRLDQADLRKSKMDAIRSEFRAFLDREEQLRNERVAQTSESTRTVLVITVLLSVIAGALLALMGRSQLIGLSKSYEGAIEAQRLQNDELSRQAWIRTGQAELSGKIRGELSVSELARRALEQVVGYAHATAAAFYVGRDDGSLDLVASHARAGAGATSGSAIALERFRRGEGLVGEVAASGRARVIRDVPADFMRVRTGLGEAAPRAVTIAPLVADGAVMGVIELAFLDDVRAETETLLSSVSEALGVALRSASYRATLQSLLHESQQLAEQLQTQQEELRVSNEELSERSHALQEAQAKMEGQHAELEQTNEQLEEQAQALDTRNRDLQEAQAMLETRAEEIEAASRYKSEFLANMSHELRTPLNSSLILAKLLKDNPTGNLTEEQAGFASTIYAAGNDLLALINDILDLAKVEAGKLEVRPGHVSVRELVQGFEPAFAPLARERHLELQLVVAPGAPSVIETDRQRIEQILRNLLSNALKFTHRGQVRLEASAAPGGRVSFAVSDTGVGIDQSQQEVIFEAFRQADGTTARKYGGTGLGLSISRNLAALLGGTITVRSATGQGSAFTLDLPLKYVSPPADEDGHAKHPVAPTRATIAPTPTPGATPVARADAPLAKPPFADDREAIAAGNGRTLLIVEDDEQFARILVDVAHEAGFKSLVAANTEDAYELAVRYAPSGVVLDMKLPDALGLSLLDRLKENPRTRHIPVHVISATDYSREAKRLGAIGFAQKPADRGAIREAFKTLESKIDQRLKRVLVVEDDSVQRMAIEKLIAGDGVQIVGAESGARAKGLLESEAFDCMVVDLSLPDMSGFDLLESLAGRSDATLPPVIVYTGRDLSRAEEERLSRYSRSIILKGARSPERLLDEVTLFLHQVESRLSPEHQRMLRSSRNRERAFDGRQILLVDDDVRNIFALTSALEQKGAHIVIARNGREALERLDAQPGVALVLMDIMMPEMDGYEAMRRIRRQPRFAQLPIIAVTAKAMRDDYERCLEAGANDYLAKPIDVDKLVSLMVVWLPKELGRA